MDIFEPLKDLWAFYSLVKQVQELGSSIGSGIQWLRHSDTVQDSFAYVRVKARSTIFPTIIERLDDGTRPEQQHLRIEMALSFPQERIENALYYRASQSMNNLVEQFWIEVDKQASRDAQPGDERSLNVTLDYMDNAAIYSYAIRVLVGSDWAYSRPPEKSIHFRRLWRKAREIQAQYLAQAKEASKTKRKK